MSRPLLSHSLVELKQLLDANPGDGGIVAQVIAELRHRKTSKARRLLQDLTSGAPVPPPADGGATGPGGDAEASAREDDLVPQQDAVMRGFVEAYEILRSTFTVESEILARWGITAALPFEMRDLLFSKWREILGDTPDELGRSRARLEHDIAAVRAERALAEEMTQR